MTKTAYMRFLQYFSFVFLFFLLVIMYASFCICVLRLGELPFVLWGVEEHEKNATHDGVR